MDERARQPHPLIGIVEDDDAVLHSLEFSLQADGYRVCAMASAEAARASDQLLAADLIILDYGLPGTTGMALLGELRRRGLKCPAIVIASNPTLRCRNETKAQGAPLVEKPLMGDALGAEIRAALSGPRP